MHQSKKKTTSSYNTNKKMLTVEPVRKGIPILFK